MNSMIMSSRKALVAKPTQSRRVASKATRRPVAMAGMQVRRRVCLFVCYDGSRAFLGGRGGADRARRGESGRERRGDPVLSLSLSLCEERGYLPRRARSGETLPQIEPIPREPLVPLPDLDLPSNPATNTRLNARANPALSLSLSLSLHFTH